VAIELREQAYLLRDMGSAMKFTAFNAYMQWYVARAKEPNSITEAEMKEHQVPVHAEAKENAALPLPPPRDATTWERRGVAQSVQPESVRDIIAQRPANPGAGRDTIKGFVDEFLNAWLAANPTQR
jgi:hypothetical protein